MAEVTHLEIASIWIDVSIREQHSWQAELSRHPIEDGANVTDHVRLLPDQIQIEGIVTNQPIELPGSHTDGALADESGFALSRERMLPTGVQGHIIEGEPSLGLLGLLPGVDQGASLLRAAGVDVRRKKQLEMVLPKLEKSSAQFQANALRFSKEFDRVKAVHDALRATFVARKPVQIVTGMRVYEAVVLIDLSIVRDAQSAGTLRFSALGEIIRMVKSMTGLAGAQDPISPRAKPKLDKGNQNTAPVPTAPAAEIPQSTSGRMSVILQGLQSLLGSR